MLRGWRAVVLVVASSSCATRVPTNQPRAPVRIPSSEATPGSKPAERSPSTGRIEGAYLAEDGVLVALREPELASVERCHRAGRPLGWALFSVDAEGTIQLVEAEDSVATAASCARDSLLPARSEVLIYLRFL